MPEIMSGARTDTTLTHLRHYLCVLFFRWRNGDRMEFEVDGSDYGLLVHRATYRKAEFQGHPYLGFGDELSVSYIIYGMECCMNDLFIEADHLTGTRVRQPQLCSSDSAIKWNRHFTFSLPVLCWRKWKWKIYTSGKQSLLLTTSTLSGRRWVGTIHFPHATPFGTM